MKLKERLVVQAMFEGLRYDHNRVIVSKRPQPKPKVVFRTIKRRREDLVITVVQSWTIDKGWNDVAQADDLTSVGA